jgi:Zn finger protein HypA/HybF involved in hydrogenase expression
MAVGIEKELGRSLELFVSAVERNDNLEIICEERRENGSDIIVVENSNINTDCEGHQFEVDLTEIFAVCKDCESTQQFIDVFNGDRHDIVLDGVTRIVGYYSRVKNWNKSKIGELRDRQSGQYGTGKHTKQHHQEALDTVNSH